MTKPDWVDTVISFWFDELSQKDWFVSSKKTDATITERFGGLYRQLVAGIPAQAAQDAETALATVIVLDQFPRNMFRGSGEAFASDHLARKVASMAIDNQIDKQLNGSRLQFLYMPLMHSEELADHERCIALFEAADDQDTLKHALEHCDIIKRFGRFPHRNRVLGRESTPEEASFLAKHSGFGQ